MNPQLKDLIRELRRKKIIGAKHTPEAKLIKRVTRCLNKKEIKEFRKEYQTLVKEGLLIRLKKATGKGRDWHISLNPRSMEVVMESLGESSVKYMEIV